MVGVVVERRRHEDPCRALFACGLGEVPGGCWVGVPGAGINQVYAGGVQDRPMDRFALAVWEVQELTAGSCTDKAVDAL